MPSQKLKDRLALLAVGLVAVLTYALLVYIIR